MFVFTRFARGGGSLAHHRVKSITLFFSHNLTGRQFLIQQGALARYQQLLLVTGASCWYRRFLDWRIEIRVRPLLARGLGARRGGCREVTGAFPVLHPRIP